VSIAALITTLPVNISPYTIGIGVPARDVFCIPLKLKDNCGSSSELKSGSFGKGNSISLTPDNTKEAPIPIAAFVMAPAAAKEPGATIGLKNDPIVKGVNKKAPPIKAAPNNTFPIPLPAPLMTGIKCISSCPTG
jgi:hypothetical protein